MTITPETKASANPTKEFFVRMLTRDISLEDCILDLIDNSVDSAWHNEGSRPMGLSEGANLDKYIIDIKLLPDVFQIKDNCGGMTLHDAVNHAFSFGRNTSDAHDDFSIGVYGIGMKRAIFKIGNQIKVRSTYRSEGEALEAFAVPIDVDRWLENNTLPWDFDIIGDEPLEAAGVEIDVRQLTQGALQAFSNPAFIQNLRRTIARDYSFHLARGLQILVNNAPVDGWQIELRQSDEFQPVRIEYVDKVGDDEVTVELIGGMAAPPPESTDPTEDEGDRRYGWYVACNGRIVLAADKTVVAGWGSEDWPQWHYQYAGFVGVVLFTAAKASALPLTTTKRSVDVSSEVFRRARPRMREISKAWIAYTNARKQALEQAKQKEALARPVSIQAVPKRSTVALPNLVAQRAEKAANINYSVPVSKLKKLARELGNINMPYREVGLTTFDYAYDDLVGNE